MVAPVVPATWEAEAGESLEPRRWKLQWAKITPLYSSLMVEQDSIKKRKEKKKSIGEVWWLTPVISTLWEPSGVDHLRSGVRDQPGQHGETPVSTKNTKISRVWWCAPVIPATLEAETGESLESGRRRLQWTELVPLQSGLGDKARLWLKKKKICKNLSID